MAFIEYLELEMRKNNISNKSELSRLSGIPYTTIDGFYKKGTDNIKLSTLRKSSECLHCSLDYLVDDTDCEQITFAEHLDGKDFTIEQWNRIKSYAKFLKQEYDSID